MNRLAKWLGILGVLITIGIALFVILFPSVTVRYRLRLEALVEGRLETGAGVIEVTYRKVPRVEGIRLLGSDVEVRGEAVTLDLGSRGVLFALLKEGADARSAAEFIVFRAAKFPNGNLPLPLDDGLRQLKQLTGKFDLPLTSLPLLVRFRDLSNQKTIERVNPLDIGRSFGSEAKLMRATLEIVPSGIWPLSYLGVTGEPITNAIESKLPWLQHLDGRYLGGGFTAREAPLELHGGDFKRE